MIQFEVFGQTFFYYEEQASFGFEEDDSQFFQSLPSISELLKTARHSAYTFCLNLIDACNLSCDYCFNQRKSGNKLTTSDAIRILETLFRTFPSGEKYFVDLSGKGEPLLALREILEIADWCHRKQDEIGKEVLVQFVCNGTLLSPAVANVLQAKGILFGVSLDGDKAIHDRHRKTKAGLPTFDSVLKNIQSIKSRDYVGCAGTITQEVFPLLEAVRALLKTFKTISFRPVRGDMRIDEKSSLLWQREYERLAEALYADSLTNDESMFLALMNGDDYFGRFLCRAFGEQIVINRCDGGITRFCVEADGRIYPCPAASGTSLSIGENLLLASVKALERQCFTCEGCEFKLLCGGECQIELSNLGVPSAPLCDLKKRMIVLANWLERRISTDNPAFHDRLSQFVDEKMARYRKDTELERYMAEHPDLSFTSAKRRYDEMNKKY